MKSYLHENREEFEELITLVADEKNIPEKAVLRDYYITYLLDNLANSSFRDVCIFKGGTSLSKCYPGTIERFSEDIDLTYIDTEGKSNKTISKGIKAIEAVIATGFESEKIGEERSELSKSMNIWHRQEGKETSVKLEIGAKIYPFPVVEKVMKSYIHDYLADNSHVGTLNHYYFPEVQLQVLDITRTFIDKIYAIKTQALAGDLSRKVRHVYDVVKLFNHEEIQEFLQDSEQMKTVIADALKASEFYVTKRNIKLTDELEGPYNFESWKGNFSESSVKIQYETLHHELLYTNEQQHFHEAIQTLEKINGILSEIEK